MRNRPRHRAKNRPRSNSNSLFRLARNANLTEEERRKAAARMAQVLLPATPTGDPSWSRAVADEYGFVISPKIASEYRDAELLLQVKLKNSNGSIRPGGERQAEKARACLAAIRRSLEPPPHSKYGRYRGHRSDQPAGLDQFQQDLRRLFELEDKRRSKIGLPREEVAEEAHRMARADTLVCGRGGGKKTVGRPRKASEVCGVESTTPQAEGSGGPAAPAATLLGCLPQPRIRKMHSIIRSAMRSPPMTATSIHTTQKYGRRRSGSMKTASRSPTYPRLSTAIPAFGPIPGKGKCRHLSYLIVSSRRRRRQNHRMIGRDDRDPPSACNPSQQPVPVAAPRSK